MLWSVEGRGGGGANALCNRAQTPICRWGRIGFRRMPTPCDRCSLKGKTPLHSALTCSSAPGRTSPEPVLGTHKPHITSSTDNTPHHRPPRVWTTFQAPFGRSGTPTTVLWLNFCTPKKFAASAAPDAPPSIRPLCCASASPALSSSLTPTSSSWGALCTHVEP